MKFGLFTYKDRNQHFNVGDHIQSLAAKQYLPRVDRLIERDSLSLLDLNEETAVIMNGWYTHEPDHWPPVDLLKPFFISFHLNSSHANKVLSKNENVEYLKKYSPIGCRDTGTVKLLQEKGINAYYSSCLTTTLDINYATEEKSDEILIVDVLYKDDLFTQYKEYPRKILSGIKTGKILSLFKRDKKIKSIIPDSILKRAKYVTHSYANKDYNEEERFVLAENLLKRYAKAKLVITSRIHCALPCIAMGTPVVFISGGGLSESSEMSRLKGVIEHLNVVSTEPISLDNSISKEINLLDPKKIDWENIKNPKGYIRYADKLKSSCLEFVQQITD
ncbi:polysaccharide pyruvyl transferase family protein [Sphingobacterium sp.]|uniref:polysaccharide pyruvyl transferase family protein n=1 Tax=Sphingobacterium sp. TaxID=341027 RepID=UPI0031DFA71D